MAIDERRSEEPIEFIENLHLVGDFTGQRFLLQEWQKEVLRELYGTINERGVRQYQYLYLEIAKKNGKTPMAAAIGIYHLMCDPPGGEIYCAAAEKEQAAQTYRYMKSMIAQDAFLNKHLRVVDSKKEIYNDATGTFVKVLSAEAYSKHGMAPSVVIVDELHAHQNRDLWDFLTFGAGSARKQPLWLTITTAGNDPDRKTIGWEVHEYARKIRDGEIADPTWCVRIYGAPEDADIYDESVWYAANPSLGVAIDIEAVRLEALAAKNSEAVERNFRWLRLNQWVSTKRISWLPITLWDKTQGKWTRDEMRGRDCYVGIDLSSTTDLTAITVLFPPLADEGWRFFIDAWIPEENMPERERRDHVPFSKWVKAGYVQATPGNVVDYSCLVQHLQRLAVDYSVKYYCADPWNFVMLRQLMGETNPDKFIEISQMMSGMSPAMHELEKMFLGGEISHEENPCGRWAFGNVVVAIDGNENKKPMKNKSIDRIDPICALIDAFAAAMKLEPKKSVYERRGLRVM